MAEYLVMLLRQYKIPVKQYVIYIGEGNVTMPTELTNENFFFRYNLIAISSIDYHIFLKSDNTEEKMFAILANFGKDKAEKVIKEIVTDIALAAKGSLERERLKNQLRVLSQLRTLMSTNREIMESVSSFFKEENDIFYQVGEKHGLEKGQTAFVKYLLAQTDFSDEKIAQVADVSVSFLEKIRASLSKYSE